MHREVAEHAGEPEDPARAPGDVAADEVPPAVPGHDAPRLDGALLGVRAPAGAVGEGHDPAVADGLERGAEGGLARGDPRLERSGDRRDVDARGLQLEQRAAGGAGERRRLPQPRREAERGGLVGLEHDLGQLVVAPGDAVARLVVVRGAVGARLERDAELAQLLLVALEHPAERLLVVGGVAGHGLADLLHRQVPPGGQQADDQVQQPLGLLGGHPGDASTRPAPTASPGD